MNQIQESLGFDVFEVSPTPSGGILILTASSPENILAFYQRQIIEMKNTLVDSCFISDLNEKVLSSYLSQNTVPDLASLSFYESNSLCAGLQYAQKISSVGLNLVDFRLIRSTHNRAIIVYVGSAIDHHSVHIPSPNSVVKSYFEVLK